MLARYLVVAKETAVGEVHDVYETKEEAIAASVNYFKLGATHVATYSCELIDLREQATVYP